MQLNQLLSKANLLSVSLPFPFNDINVSDIKADSRTVGPFDVFVSIPCPTAVEYIQDALSRGCRVFIIETENADLPIFAEHDAIAVPTENPRLALARLSSVFYDEQPDYCVAVTGTNGKSSTVHFVRQFFDAQHCPSASVGTLGLALNQSHAKPEIFDDILKGASLTTLDSLRMHQLMKQLKQNGINYLAFEASSHGLDQYRLHGSKITAAAFTNLTQDHLDYHQSEEAYFQAKCKLFSEILPSNGMAILNKDCDSYNNLVNLCQSRGQKIVSYSRTQKADIYITHHHIDGLIQYFDLTVLGETFKNISIHISGDFQLENIMAALGLVLACDLSLHKCIETLPSLTPAQGRLECVTTFNNIPVFVDYAHTPDALQKTLQNLKPYTKKKLWVIFGCGGNRDNTKRPIMGQIASECADYVIITDDNPRFEDPVLIREQIIAGITNVNGIYKEIANRSKAIEYAIQHAHPGDTILIAGKGHEQGQLVGHIMLPFDDKEEAIICINALKK